MDPMFTLLWQRYRMWAITSRTLKEQNASWKRRVLVLTIVGTALATVGPHVGQPSVARALPLLGAAALAVATFFGKELLDAAHEERWVKARAAAEALKSEAARYLVQVPPYDGPDRPTKLKARLDQLNGAIDGQPDDIPDEKTLEGIATTAWKIEDYLLQRVQDQITFYNTRAAAHTAAMKKGRAVSLGLGCASVLLGALTGARPEGATLSAAILGLVTTVGASIGAYFQAGHYEALALKYRETAHALATLKAEFQASGGRGDAAALVDSAETIMQAEHAAWLTEMIAIKT
jgi:hypothetical protein